MSDFIADLRERRLLPIIALLLVCLIAIPFLMGGGGDEAVPPPPTASGEPLPGIETRPVVVATPAELRRAPTTAGRPPRGTRVEIVDGNGDPMPRGRTGHIVVGNDMLVDRYTSGAATGMRKGMLATGDLGHIDADGLVFVDGREDDMIVSGGENVSASQVEGLLAGLPQVREVAVTGVPDREFGQRLAAWIALRPGTQLDADQVREHVRRNLARFAVPRDVRFVDALPRNETGKLPRAALLPLLR